MWDKIWKDPVWSKVIATAIVAVAGVAGTLLFGYGPAVGDALFNAWSFVLKTSRVPNWAIGVLSLGTIVSLWVLVAYAWYAWREDSATPAARDWTSYTNDAFFGLRWRWLYSGGRIIQLNTFCPRCDYQLFSHEPSGYNFINSIAFSCECCNGTHIEFKESESELNSKVERLIQQKVRTGAWNAAEAA